MGQVYLYMGLIHYNVNFQNDGPSLLTAELGDSSVPQLSWGSWTFDLHVVSGSYESPYSNHCTQRIRVLLLEALASSNSKGPFCLVGKVGGGQ